MSVHGDVALSRRDMRRRSETAPGNAVNDPVPDTPSPSERRAAGGLPPPADDISSCSWPGGLGSCACRPCPGVVRHMTQSGVSAGRDLVLRRPRPAQGLPQALAGRRTPASVPAASSPRPPRAGLHERSARALSEAPPSELRCSSGGCPGHAQGRTSGRSASA
jgi:hypothetical protein